jgi:tRNA-splicing ligase RtcB
MSNGGFTGPIEKIDEWRWRVPRRYKREMRTDGILYASERMLQEIKRDQSLEQLANVACLPGIVGFSLAMPDIHWGYGFPIGGVAAFDVETGVISPGGIGYDINCGVRLLRTSLTRKDVEPRLEELLRTIFQMVPCGVGSESKLRLSRSEFEEVLVEGARWAVRKRGMGWEEDLERTEENGAIDGAEPRYVSSRAIERGLPQIGTLGAGNHFLEVQVVEEIYNQEIARKMGIEEVGQVTVMIHCGSRGFGHQVCDDYLEVMRNASRKYNIYLPDIQLACAPFKSEEAQRYFGAMKCAVNYAFANRQAIAHWVRKAFEKVFGKSAEELGLHMVYDVAHNIAKVEEHEVDGEKKKLVVHRKGATRAFPAGHPDVPRVYRDVGQPVLVPGDMGTRSYLLVGTQLAMKETWGSTAHGAGRVLSRAKAAKSRRAEEIQRELEKQGIIVIAASRKTLVEEAPEAYKDVDEVARVVHGAGISLRVARMRPIGVVKG